MSTLYNQQIDQTYQGLIKTTNNGIISASEQVITDGLGNASTLKLGTTSASFVGTLNLTGATVTGIPVSGLESVVAGTNITIDNTDPLNPIVSATDGGLESVVAGTNITIDNTDPLNPIVSATDGGAAGLVNGTVENSIKSSDTLTTISCSSTAINAIAIGNGADANSAKNIAIGTGNAGSSNMIIIGDSTGPVYASNTVAIGNNMPTDLAFRGDSVSVGNEIYPSYGGVYIGNDAKHITGGNTFCVAIGRSATTSGDQSISLGAQTLSLANNSVAIGYGVTASTANTVTIKKLQMLDYGSLGYADDAAASTGGIPLGGVYHTAGILKIRIV